MEIIRVGEVVKISLVEDEEWSSTDVSGGITEMKGVVRCGDVRRGVGDRGVGIVGRYRDKLSRYFIAVNKIGLLAIRYLFIYVSVSSLLL